MVRLDWLGPAPPRALVAALAARHVRVHHVRAAGEAPCAVMSSGARRPRVPSAPAWIWVCDGRVDDSVATAAVLDGAYDVVSLDAADAVEKLAVRAQELAATPPAPALPPDVVARSAAAQRMFVQAARAARTSMAVLLTGETGAGKELVARLVHQWSARRDHRLVAINCAAIPNDLMEAELFGYARGAFTGASHEYDGQLAAAAGGTVFLDEIDDTPPALQVKLLRVLEDRVVNRLGENTWRAVDFRIIAATNRNLRALVEAGDFGADLYERLAIVTIALPPLRERLEDLPELAQRFVERFYVDDPSAQPRVRGLREDALRALSAYPWPGNVRELRNVVWETLVYKHAGEEIIPSDLPRRVLGPGSKPPQAALIDRAAVARKLAARTLNLREEMAALQRAALGEALALTGGNAAEAARLLGAVGRGRAKDPGGTVRAMMRRLGRRA